MHLLICSATAPAGRGTTTQHATGWFVFTTPQGLSPLRAISPQGLSPLRVYLPSGFISPQETHMGPASRPHLLCELRPPEGEGVLQTQPDALRWGRKQGANQVAIQAWRSAVLLVEAICLALMWKTRGKRAGVPQTPNPSPRANRPGSCHLEEEAELQPPSVPQVMLFAQLQG